MTARFLPDDPHDRAWVEQVRPTGHVNPTPQGRYHLVVLGGGTAGLVCAAGAAQLGARVALVEKHLLGGDCLSAGCVPSKSLLAAARGPLRADFPAAMERLRRQRAELAPNDSVERFRRLGVDVFLGTGRFTGPDTAEVDGATLRFRRAVIATGSRPAAPEVAGAMTSDEVFTLTALPSRLAVVGAGPVGCELAQAFARFGARVTLHDRGGRVLHREEPDAAAIVQGALERDGVTFVPTGQVGGDFDAVLFAAGRLPNVEGLGLDAAGVAYDRQGVKVNDYLRTSNPRVYAAGDVCSRFRFTHAADAYARVVIRNALFWGWGRASGLTIPWCTYTEPEIGRVGLSQAEAKEQGIAVDVFDQPFGHVDRAVLDGEAEGLVRVLARRGTDRIVGATVVGAHAGDLIGTIGLAMTHGLGLRRLAATVFPYPTRTEALRKLGDAYNRTRLTPWARWLLRVILG